MHSIEIINAINEVGVNASDVARSKAEHWIQKGVERAIIKALWEIEVELAGALDEVEISPEARERLLGELDSSALVLKNPHIQARLVKSAYRRRNA